MTNDHLLIQLTPCGCRRSSSDPLTPVYLLLIMIFVKVCMLIRAIFAKIWSLLVLIIVSIILNILKTYAENRKTHLIRHPCLHHHYLKLLNYGYFIFLCKGRRQLRWPSRSSTNRPLWTFSTLLNTILNSRKFAYFQMAKRYFQGPTLLLVDWGQHRVRWCPQFYKISWELLHLPRHYRSQSQLDLNHIAVNHLMLYIQSFW